MRKVLTIIFLAFVVLACREGDESESRFILEAGTYQGTFIRTSPNIRWAPADVKVTLKDGRFSGSSDTNNYPAICEGTYQTIGNNKVSFENECAWTADFDWSFILDGDFQVYERDEKLIITREYEGSVVDTYELTLSNQPD